MYKLGHMYAAPVAGGLAEAVRAFHQAKRAESLSLEASQKRGDGALRAAAGSLSLRLSDTNLIRLALINPCPDFKLAAGTITWHVATGLVQGGP